MNLKALQLLIRDKINADSDLLQGRCKAFAEDALDARNEPEPALHAGGGGIALVVRTPTGELAAAGREIFRTVPAAWHLATPLTAETRAALTAQGFTDIDSVTIENGTLKIGTYSVAVRVESNAAYYLGGDFIIGFASGELVAEWKEEHEERAGFTLPLSCTLAIDCIEIPAINRAAPSYITAMQAAERVAHLLHDGQTVTLERFDSDILHDGETRFFLYTAAFRAHITHTL